MADALLERDVEIMALGRALRELGEGRGRLVVIEAAVGLGKTALLRHTRGVARAAGATVLSARGAEWERDFAFGAVRQLIEPVLPDDGVQRARLFSGATAAAEVFDGGQTGDRDQPLFGLYRLLANLTAGAPAVLLVDGAQWLDVPSLRFLGFLARRLDTLPVTVVVATRPHDRDDGLLDDLCLADDAIVLAPAALSVTAVATLVRAALGPAASPALAGACHAATGGNPLYLTELLRLLAAGREPDVAAVRAVGPVAVRRHLAARLRRQPPCARKVARAVAVLGDDADLSLVARHSDLTISETAMAAEKLARHGILAHAEPPDFGPAAVRDAVLSLIPLAERGAEHRRAVAVLADVGSPATRIAAHLLHIPPEGDPARVDVLLAAAVEARTQGAPGTAAVFLRRACTEPPPRHLRSEVHRLLGDCQADLDPDDAEPHLRAALALADSAAQRSLCAYRLALLRTARGAPAEAVDLLSHAVADLPAAQRGELAAELVGLARHHIASRPRAKPYLAALRAGPPSAALDAQLSMEALLSGGPVADAIALAHQALAGDRLTPDRAGYWTAIHTLMVTDQLDEAVRRLNRSLRTAPPSARPLVGGLLARCALLQGDLALAADHVRLGTAGVHGPHLALPVLQAVQVRLLVEEGRLAAADDVLRASTLPDCHDPQTGSELWLLDARMRLRIAQDLPRQVLADARACERLYGQWDATRLLDVPWRLEAAWAHRRLGDHERATALVDEQLRLAESFGVPRHIGLALRSAALLGDSRRLMREAADRFRHSAARLELARTLEYLGTALLADGDRHDGRQVVAQAAELAAECRAVAMTERLRALLTGADRTPSRGVDALTPAERQVAELATGGLTNRQIAERLFLSEKTVEAHLSRAFRKVGVRSRTQLAVYIAAGT